MKVRKQGKMLRWLRVNFIGVASNSPGWKRLHIIVYLENGWTWSFKNIRAMKKALIFHE